MKPSELHPIFINELRELLSDWRFVSTSRHFKRTIGSANLLFHIAWVNHTEDFDAIGNVAVEFLAGKKRVAVVGAQLGNIAGVGQTRHTVASVAGAKASALSLVQEFEKVGLPFLEKYSSPENVISALQSGGAEAQLISPIQNLHKGQVQALQAIVPLPNNSIQGTPSKLGSLPAVGAPDLKR